MRSTIPQEKIELQQKLDEQIKLFLAEGGVIKQFDHGEQVLLKMTSKEYNDLAFRKRIIYK